MDRERQKAITGQEGAPTIYGISQRAHLERPQDGRDQRRFRLSREQLLSLRGIASENLYKRPTNERQAAHDIQKKIKAKNILEGGGAITIAVNVYF